MRVPIRKGGKHTHDKPDPHLTKEKYEELKVKLEKMRDKQPYLAAEVKRLAADGDFSENVPYQMAKGRLRGLLHRIHELDKHLKSAIIIEPNKNTNSVQIGSRVEVEVNGKTKIFTILGSTETDPSQGIISHLSPIGSALMNRKAGEKVVVDINSKMVEYLLKKIY